MMMMMMMMEASQYKAALIVLDFESFERPLIICLYALYMFEITFFHSEIFTQFSPSPISIAQTSKPIDIFVYNVSNLLGFPIIFPLQRSLRVHVAS